MAINNYITDPTTQRIARVLDGEEVNALAVATRPLKDIRYYGFALTNDTYGADMNKDGSATGTPENIHDGTDNSYWSATAIAGTWNFASSETAYAGSLSIDATDTGNGSTAEISGATITISDFQSLSGFVKLTTFIPDGNNIRFNLWDTASGQIGDSINIDQYIKTSELGTWQKFVIPIEDFNVSASYLNSIRIQTIKTAGANPDYYLDNLLFTGAGSGIIYEFSPRKGTWFHYERGTIILGANIDATKLGGSGMPFRIDEFFGLPSLTAGVLFNAISEERQPLPGFWRNLRDILQIPGVYAGAWGGDSTSAYMMIHLDVPYPTILKYEDGDKLRTIINDDMTGLTHFNISVWGGEEVR